MSASRSLLDRLPLKPHTAASVLAAALALVTAEFVRSGLYGGYFTQVIDTKYGLPVAVGGLVYTVHIIADTVMRAPAGIAIQRYGPRIVVMMGALLSLLALSLLLLPGSYSVGLVLLIAALHGVGFSPVWPTMMNLTADAAMPGYEGRTLTVATSSLMPLVGLGFVVYGVMAKRPDFPLMLLSLGLLAASALSATLLPARRALNAAHDEKPKTKGALSQRLRRLLRPVLPLLPAAIMQTLTQAIVGIWLFRMAPELGLSEVQLMTLLVVGGVAAFAAFPRTGKIADGGRARFALMVGYVLCAAGMLGFALTPPTWVLFALAPLIGLGYAFITPGFAALVAQTLPEEQRPAAWGVIMTVESGSMALGPFLGGLTYEAAGAPGPFVLNAALCLLTAAGYLILKRLYALPARPTETSGLRQGDMAYPVQTPATLDADHARATDGRE